MAQVIAPARIPLLAWELTYAVGVAEKEKKTLDIEYLLHGMLFCGTKKSNTQFLSSELGIQCETDKFTLITTI